MFNKILDKISEIGFVYKDTNESHNSIVESYYYYPDYTNAYYRFTITTNKRIEEFKGLMYEKKGIYLVYFTNDNSGNVKRLLDKHFYVDLSTLDCRRWCNLDEIYLFLNKTFALEYRDIKLKKLLCYI